MGIRDEVIDRNAPKSKIKVIKLETANVMSTMKPVCFKIPENLKTILFN